MKRRVLFLAAVAAGFLVLGSGALDARAGQISLPTTYNAFVNSTGTSNGNFTVVSGAENLKFSNFTYTSSSSPPPGSPGPAPATLGVTAYTVGNETGFNLNGTLNAAAATFVDISITYTVTAPAGEKLTDAFLATTGGNFGGTGQYSVSETLVNALNNAPIGTLESSLPGAPADTINFAGVQSINVTKDIFLSGGTNGVTLSVITQAFSSQGTIPEPTSLALLGIGMTGFLAFRRFFKKTSVA
jgi:hypothetical protein